MKHYYGKKTMVCPGCGWKGQRLPDSKVKCSKCGYLHPVPVWVEKIPGTQRATA